MSVFGIDYAWDGPSISSMLAANVTFACRYLSHDAGKDLNLKEATALAKAGIFCVVVWETTAERPRAGRTAGVADAREARDAAEACGMPADRPIYFAADWDATAGDQEVINAYLDGAASVLGRERVGLYAGYYPIKRAFDAGKIAWGWQTYAWSGGHWDKRAHIQQYKNGVNLGGSDVDYDRAMADDYGQWKPGESPMAFSDADKKWLTDNLFKLVWQQDKVPVPTGVDGTTNPTWQPVNLERETYTRVLELRDLLAELRGLVTAIGRPQVDPEDTDAIAAAVAGQLSDTLATKLLDALKARLES